MHSCSLYRLIDCLITLYLQLSYLPTTQYLRLSLSLIFAGEYRQVQGSSAQVFKVKVRLVTLNHQ